MLKNCLNVWQI